MDAGVGMLLIPLVLVLLVFALAATGHGLCVKNTAFQGVYVRALALFPVAALVAGAGGIEPKLFHWAEVLVGVLEGYVFILFFGLVTAWAWCHGDVHKRLAAAPTTSHSCFCAGRALGKQFASGEESLRHLRWQAYQFAIVKPLLALVDAIKYAVDGQPLPRGAKTLLTVVNVLSIITCIRSLVNLYRALKGMGPGQANLLVGLRAFQKFSVVKGLLFFVVINEVLFLNLIRDGALTPPPGLCDQLADSPAAYCDDRFVVFIFLWEAFVLSVLAAAVFRPNDMDLLPKDRVLAYALPIGEADSAEAQKKTQTRLALMKRVPRLGDVMGELLKPPVGGEPPATDAEEPPEAETASTPTTGERAGERAGSGVGGVGTPVSFDLEASDKLQQL